MKSENYHSEFGDFSEDPFEAAEQARLFEISQYERSGGGGDLDEASSSARNHDEGLRAVPSVDGQMELDLGIPTEEEAHKMWRKVRDEKDSLHDIANRVYDQKKLPFNEHEKEEIINGLMYEGMLALRAWKRDRGRSLISYVWDRMKRRLSRIIATVKTDPVFQAASIQQRQKFYSIKTFLQDQYPEDVFEDFLKYHYEEFEKLWVESGENPDLLAWLCQDLVWGDETDLSKQDKWSRLLSDFRPMVEQQHVPGSLAFMNDEEIWDYLFHEETLPLWTQELDADDFRVLDQRRADPEASARQIGRILGHDKNWVIRREDKIKRALKGFITITEEVSNDIK